MCAPVQIAESVESFDGQGQNGDEPPDQQTVGVMAADMLDAVIVLGFVEALVLDLPATLGHAVEGRSAHARGRKIRQPIGFDHCAVRLVIEAYWLTDFPSSRVGAPSLY